MSPLHAQLLLTLIVVLSGGLGGVVGFFLGLLHGGRAVVLEEAHDAVAAGDGKKAVRAWLKEHGCYLCRERFADGSPSHECGDDGDPEGQAE